MSDEPETISFEESADACAETIGLNMHEKYGLTITKEMVQDFSLAIQEHFNAHEI